ncbi:glycosyltransferase family 2 protein [Pseudonocardia sp.]|uniref:glycosyltransferase family 2 protein n=1 Tax=Pseudonocardia sp. TaxID=60912 RepID=UPI0025F067BD|nr:glycosyltransferase family 2 protein [Pseudonocardia sp.]
MRQVNNSRPAALNTGVRAASHDIVVMLDGDTVFEPSTVRLLVQPFARPEVGAVAGNAKVANRTGLVARWQHIEYVIGFNLDRRVQDEWRCMTPVPGAVGAFRRAEREKLRPLWLLPLQQLVYRQLMYAVLIQSIATALTGIRLRWQKLRRVGDFAMVPHG